MKMYLKQNIDGVIRNKIDLIDFYSYLTIWV
jgi:hypothetical protein